MEPGKIFKGEKRKGIRLYATPNNNPPSLGLLIPTLEDFFSTKSSKNVIFGISRKNSYCLKKLSKSSKNNFWQNFMEFLSFKKVVHSTGKLQKTIFWHSEDFNRFKTYFFEKVDFEKSFALETLLFSKTWTLNENKNCKSFRRFFAITQD